MEMKSQVFCVGHYRIDLSRSLITSPTQELTAEPKILQVLKLLAQHQGEVVTHKEIMSTVWRGVEVAPNALQRAIAQLRKALGDDAKRQQIIATHPRIGYRLVAEVNWHPDGAPSPAPAGDSTIAPPPVAKRFRALYLVPVLAMLLLVAYLMPGRHDSLRYTRITQLTHSDQNESDPLYSLDGNYIIFNRRSGACKRHLWARETASGKEHRLTTEPGQYGRASFTPDGGELVFAAGNLCQAAQPPQSFEKCWHIATLDFAAALATPQAPRPRHRCGGDKLATPKALSNNQYAFLELSDNQTRLMHLDERTGDVRRLYQPADDTLYYFDYDANKQRFALISRDNNGQDVLELVSRSGEPLSRQVIRRPAHMSRYQYLEANFAPSGNYLVTSSYQGPQQLSLEGELTPIQVPENRISNVAIHPNLDKLLAVRGQFDHDIAQLSLAKPQPASRPGGFNRQYQPYPSLARSTSSEHSATYQPGGDAIAFVSDRTGSDQLWLWHRDQARQLTFTDNNRKLNSYVWSPDGRRLAYVLNDQLTLISLDGDTQQRPTAQPLLSVLDWYDERSLLVLANTDKYRALFRYDLETDALTSLNIDRIKKAWVSDGQLIYADLEFRVWQAELDNIRPTRQWLEQLHGKSMLVKPGQIYSVDPDSQLLSRFELASRRQMPLGPLKDRAWWVTDIRDQQLLLEQSIAARVDIVELE